MANQTATGNTFNKRLDDGVIVYVPDLTGLLPTVQGQITVFDQTLNSGNGGVRAATTQADVTKFVGIADQNSLLNSLNELLPTVRVGFKNVYNLLTTSAEIYTMGEPVYFSETATGSATVTNSSNAGARSVVIGYVILPNEYLLAGKLTLTGAVGITVPVAVRANFPVAGLG